MFDIEPPNKSPNGIEEVFVPSFQNNANTPTHSAINMTYGVETVCRTPNETPRFTIDEEANAYFED